jgi:hypothetical protein
MASAILELTYHNATPEHGFEPPGPMARHVKQPEGYTAMWLDQQFADIKAEFPRTAPAGRGALYEAKIEELRAS